MPAKIQKYPLYVYDEPQTYEDFSGGINTDPSNEHLTENELRDCLNMTYMSGALVKRKGAKLLCDISCDEDLHNIQGVFLFTYKITYLIIAADGKLYQGFFNEHSTVNLTRLRILKEPKENELLYDPEDLLVGLDEYFEEQTNITHNGFIHTYLLDKAGNIERLPTDKYKGNFYDITSGIVSVGDIVDYNGSRYQCIKEFTKDIITLDNQAYWEYLGALSDEEAARMRVLKEWDSNTTFLWHKDVIVKQIKNTGTDANGNTIWKMYYYKCIKSHYTYSVYPSDINFFEKITEQKEFIFQNTRKVEAVTYNNKLYIATGTRLIEVYLLFNELRAHPIIPYKCNNTEITHIGFNYMSPYPEYCRETQYNTVTTSIAGLLAVKNIYGSYTLTPQMNFQSGESEIDYLYRWEKRINGNWYVIHTFNSQVPSFEESNGDLSILDKPNLFTINVDDADIFQYRVTFAKSFEASLTNSPEWDYTKDYKEGDTVLVEGSKIFKCLKAHNPSDEKIAWEDHYTTFQTSTPAYSKTIKLEDGTTSIEAKESVAYWELVLVNEIVTCYNSETNKLEKRYDLSIDKVAGSYFGQATSVPWTKIQINDTFNKIHTCTKIHLDGNKMLLYDDAYNSGEWFKTIVNNPGYITDRGGLSFKTTKNEAVVKVVAFQGNIIVFANSENTGGSIHMVVGNGDDYDAQDGYYSPYRRSTKNSNISCDNPDTVQICENLLLFKYFDTVYYISASDLSNEVFQVTSCNDRIKLESKDIQIPWDDNSCISEVTKDYYALIWKEKYDVDNGELILIHPAMRVKMYYKMSHQIGNKYFSPWLRDESDYLNVDFILYLKGEPIYLYNNTLLSFSKNVYTDLDKTYPCKIHFRAVDLGYPKIFKLLSSVLVYYHRNQYSNIDFDIESKNEAGHLLLANTEQNSIQDLRALRVGDIKGTDKIRIDSTILDSKIFNTSYKFPFLIIDTVITSHNNKEFSVSSITYNYTSTDIPDSNPYNLYSSIIRIKEV